MKNIFGVLSEARIRVAIAQGDFDNLPGKGKPLAIENLYILPPELRAAYLVLKNSGYLESGLSPESTYAESPDNPETASLIEDRVIMKKHLKETSLRYRITMEFRSRR